MLVALVNAVKVESVPLNFDFFAAPAGILAAFALPKLRGDRRNGRICDLSAVSAPSGQWMEMHIAVVAASAPSHMHPHLALVRELVERGHRVSYLVSGHLADLAAPTGADVVGCTSVLPGAPGAPADWSGDDVAGMRLFLDEAIHVLPQMHAALDAKRSAHSNCCRV